VGECVGGVVPVAGAEGLGDGGDARSRDVLGLLGRRMAGGSREKDGGGVPVGDGRGGAEGAEDGKPDGGADLASGVDDARGGAGCARGNVAHGDVGDAGNQDPEPGAGQEVAEGRQGEGRAVGPAQGEDADRSGHAAGGDDPGGRVVSVQPARELRRQ
jgi:hypothetical protein